MEKIYLLGGHDLEMLEIKKILIQQNLNFLDRNLRWGAKLSDYQDIFTEKTHFIGIELTEDVAKPPHYTRIDHHNELTHLPPSIQQIADLLDIKLDRWQSLVAANDGGYIPAMQKMGASDVEIQAIRLADRAAQGATPEDEAAAERSIKKMKTIGYLKIVKSEASRFSCITDRLFGSYENLLIFTDHELTFYGIKKPEIEVIFTQKMARSQFYTGGGFIGVPSNAISAQELQKLVNLIKKQDFFN